VEFVQKWARRAVTIPLYLALCVLWVAMLPGLLLLAGAIDLISRQPWVLLRSTLLFALYLCCEAAGITASAALWVFSGVWLRRRQTRFLDRNFALQRWWAGTLFRGTVRIFRIAVKVEGEDELRLAPQGESRRPVIVFIRHASIADTLLPARFIANPNGIRLRYVLKRQLLWDPCLDIVGNRLPNCFIKRELGDSRIVRRLLDGLGPGDGVIIYPEGTRFTPAKLDRAVARLRDSGHLDLAQRASRFRSVLPPRLGGALSLLGSNPGADVIFCAHSGLEGVVAVRDFMQGSLVGRQVRVRFSRVPFEQIPAGADAQAEWLFDEWARIDGWVTSQLAADSAQAEKRDPEQADLTMNR